jgi:hypothetical protein
MATKGFPELKQHYTMLGAPDNVMLNRGEKFGHNYNYVSRAAMYSWFNRHLKLGLKEPIVEEDYKRLTGEEMSVWDDKHPKPEGGPEFDRKLMRWLTDDANKQLRELGKAPAKHRELVAGAIDVIIGRNLDEVGDVEWDLKLKQDRGDFLEMAGLLRNKTHVEELPVVFLNPKQWNQRTVIWVTETGKAGLFAEGSPAKPKAEVQKLLDAGVTVIGMDLLFQGEFLADGKPVTQTRRVKNPREAGAFTFGYNHTLFAQRVHDVLAVVKFVRDHERKSDSIDVIGLGAAGPWVAAALPLAKGSINRAVIEPGDFRFGKIMDLHDPGFLPGGAKYGDLPGMIALSEPVKVLNVGKDSVTATTAVDSLTRK